MLLAIDAGGHAVRKRRWAGKARMIMRPMLLAALGLLSACGETQGSPPPTPRTRTNALSEGPLPAGDTEIGRAVTRPERVRARYCGDMGLVDMGSAVDGPAYYFRRRDGVIVGRCGGFCMGDIPPGRCARECPPPGWQCHPAAGYDNR